MASTSASQRHPHLLGCSSTAFFTKLLLDNDGTIRAELAEPFANLLEEELATEAAAYLAGKLVEGRVAEATSQNDEAVAPRRGDGFWVREPPKRSGALM